MKSFLSAAVMLSMAAVLSAFTLPTGQETVVHDSRTENGKVVAVVLAVPVTFDTSIGTITGKAGSRCDFYESGALKFVYSDEVKDVTMPCGSFKLTTFHSSRNGVPFEFYENGNLKTALIARKGKVFIQTPIGKLEAMQATKLTFFEDGSIESFAVYPNQKINFGGLSGTYVQSKTLAFYKNKSVKTLTSSAEEYYAPLGIKVKKATEITFSESGSIISFTPADNSIVKLGEMFLLCEGRKFELHENGSIKKCTIECGNQDFAIGNVLFAYKTAKEQFGGELSFIPTAYLTLEFSENGTLLSAFADKTSSYDDAFPIIGGIGNTLWSAKKILFYDDGKLFCIDYAFPLPLGEKRVISRASMPFYSNGFARIETNSPIDVKVSQKHTAYLIQKLYFTKDGSPQYFLGNEITDDPNVGFDTEIAFGLFTVKNKAVVERLFPDGITASSDLVFDENGTPVAYTTTEQGSDAVIQKPLKK